MGQEFNGRLLNGIFKLANPKHGPPADAFASTNVLQPQLCHGARSGLDKFVIDSD